MTKLNDGRECATLTRQQLIKEIDNREAVIGKLKDASGVIFCNLLRSEVAVSRLEEENDRLRERILLMEIADADADQADTPIEADGEEKADVAALKKEIVAAAAEIADLDVIIADASDENDKLHDAVGTLQKANDVLENELRLLRENSEGQLRKSDEAAIRLLWKEIDRLQRQLGSEKAESDAMLRDNEWLQAELEEATKQRSDCAARIETLAAQNKKLCSIIANMNLLLALGDIKPRDDLSPPGSSATPMAPMTVEETERMREESIRNVNCNARCECGK